MSDSELDNVSPASWYDEEPNFQGITSSNDPNLDLSLGVNSGFPSCRLYHNDP